MARVDNVSDVEANLCWLGHAGEEEGICDLVSILLDVGLCKESSSNDRVLVRSLILKHINVELEKGRERPGVCIVRDTSGLQLIVQWLQDSVELSLGCVRCHKRSNVKTAETRSLLKVHKDAVVSIVI